MNIDRLTVEVRHGPALECCLDAVALLRQSLDLIPEWHRQQRRKIRAEIKHLEAVVRELQIEKGGG